MTWQYGSSGQRARPAAIRLEQLEARETPATLPTGFTEVAVATGLSAATAMEFAPNGDLWVTQQGGLLKRFRPGNTTADVVANVADLGLRSEGERGLLGIAFDPDYAANKRVYLYYTSTSAPNPHNRVSRFVVNDGNPADYSFVDTNPGVPGPDETVVVDLDPLSGATNHNGGAIHFGPDGKLYVAVGDNASGANAQSPATRHGKILRYNADGTIPGDNPATIAGLGTTSGANRAIWAAGLRNPYTFTFQPGTGRMFVNDVGQNTWEEVNEGGAGRNFGWPGTEGDFTQASFPNFTRPVYAYSHGGGTFQGFAVTGGAFYNPATAAFPAEYVGDYFYADYVNNWINVIDADGSNPRRFATGAQSTVDLRVTADGSLYYLGYGSGQAFRVTYTGSLAPAITQQPQNATVSAGGTGTFTVGASGTAPLTYRWQKLTGSTWGNLANGPDTSGATTPTLTLTTVDAADAGQYRAVVTNAAGSATSTAATLTVTANQPPAAAVTITGGLTNGKFVAGQAVTFSGSATDPEDGPLGASALTWQVDYITSTASGNPVVRPFVPAFSGQTGGTFTPATTGPYTLTDVAYRVSLTARDSAGQTTTRTADVLPNVATLTIQTTPTGLTVTVDGQPYTSPAGIASVVGFERPLGAPSPQTAGGTTYVFQSWSDGGAATHTISTPAANTTYTATFQPPPAASAAYVGANGSAQGNWRAAFGADGYSLAQGAASLPAYATVSISGNQNWTWAASTADVRALQKPAPAADRLAAAWYSGDAFTVDLTLTGGTRRVSLYFLDWDSTSRGQRVEVLNAATGAVLDTRDVTGFNGGRYLTWDLAGAVRFRVTRTAGANAVLSGLFFGDPPPAAPGSAAFVGTDASTSGNWRTTYGGDGYSLAQGAANVPAYAAVSIGGNQDWTWAGSTADPRALQKPAPAADRLAAAWYSATSFTVDVDVNGGTAKRVSLYFLDWDNGGRAATIEVLNRSSGAVLDTRSVSAFTGGKYLTWDLAGPIQFRVTRTAGANAVLSGLFFGGSPPASPPATATFVGANSTTQGTWRNTFGADGYSLAQGAGSLPGYATLALVGKQDWTWAASTTDVRALQKPAPATDRLAAAWYSSTDFAADVTITGAARRVTLYFLDWDTGGRGMAVEVVDANSGAVLDTRTVSAFTGGRYLTWDVGGRVSFRLTRTAGANAVLSGVFFDPAA